MGHESRFGEQDSSSVALLGKNRGDPPLVLALVSCHGAGGCRLPDIWVMEVGLGSKTHRPWHTGREQRGGPINEAGLIYRPPPWFSL
jgi:hypothetical protein